MISLLVGIVVETELDGLVVVVVVVDVGMLAICEVVVVFQY